MCGQLSLDHFHPEKRTQAMILWHVVVVRNDFLDDFEAMTPTKSASQAERTNSLLYVCGQV